MSCQPRWPHSSRCSHPPARSAKARPQLRDGDAGTTVDTGRNGTRPARTPRESPGDVDPPAPLLRPCRHTDHVDPIPTAGLTSGPVVTLPALAVVLVWIGVLVLPGALLAAAAGLRAAVVGAVAPLLTYGLATVSGSVAGLVPVPWGPRSLAVEAAVLGALLLLVRRARPRPPRVRRPAAPDLAVAGGVALGGLFSAVV